MDEVQARYAGTATWTIDATADDSDKTFTVPTGKIWDLQMIQVRLVTTASAGNRTLVVLISNATPTEVWWHFTNYNHAANTDVRYHLFKAASRYTSASPQTFSLPDLLLPAGYTIRVYDAAAIDATHDDMTVVLHYKEYDA